MMAHGFAADFTAPILPEIDEVDGYSFVAFEELHQMSKYVSETTYRLQKRAERSSGYQTMTKKARRITSSAAETHAKRKWPKTTHPPSSNHSKDNCHNTATTAAGMKKSAIVRHRQRLRKSDKKVIAEKMCGFVFVSGFTLQDLDGFDGEVGNFAATKRKAEAGLVACNAAKKPRKKEKYARETANRASRQQSEAQLGHAASSTINMQAQKHILARPSLKKPGQKNLNIPVPKPGSSSSSTVQLALHRKVHAYRGRKIPAAPLSKRSVRPRIDSLNCNESLSYSSDSEILDVCGIDEIPTSSQFIEENKNLSTAVKPKGSKVKVTSDRNDISKPRSKKKKCKMCCAHPCKIVEAKRVNSLWGTAFPSYNVSCVSTCKVHLPGNITVYPNETKIGFIDSSIQTTASDIEMHQNFAERFPHQAIAVKVHGRLPSETPLVKQVSHFNVKTSKTEHHRTSEQKRREQLHDSFVKLRRVVCVSQPMFDNQRTSKQWILEEAHKVINLLNSESVLLSALKKNLTARNQKLKRKWAELSGKRYDAEETKKQDKEPSQSKLMSLYKQYRKNVQKEKPMDDMISDFPKTVPDKKNKHLSDGSNVKGFKKLNQNSFKQKSKNKIDNVTNSNEPIVISEGEDEIPDDKKENSLKKWSSSGQASVGTISRLEANGKECQAIPANHPDVHVNKFTRATPKTKPSEFTSLARKDQHITLSVSKPSESKTDRVIPSTVHKQIACTVNNSILQTNTKCKTSVEPTVKSQYLNFPSLPTNSTSSSNSNETSSSGHVTSKPTQNNQPTQPNIFKKSQPLPVVRLSSSSTKNPATIAPLNVVNKIITLNKMKQMQPVSNSNVLLGKPNNVFVLSNKNQVVVGKPNQWTGMGNMVPCVFNMMPPAIEDVGAIIEVGETGCEKSQKECNDKIVLLDVAETEKKSPEATSREQGRTISFIPAASSINVTLNSVGSITSNKIYNKKPSVPSTQSTFPNILYQPSRINSPKTTQDKPSIEKQDIKSKHSTFATGGPLVPKISDALLCDLDSTDEPGLCIISNVFSLSDEKSAQRLSQGQPESSLELTNNLHTCDKQNSTRCENQDSPLVHDHSYHKLNLQRDETTSV